MCGIFGVFRKTSEYGTLNSTNNNKILRTLFTSMALSSMSRGRDSTGVILARAPDTEVTSYYQGETTHKEIGSKVYTVKDRVPANEFVTGEKFLKIASKMDKKTWALIGHTRASSSAGPHDNANNHPHVCGSIVGIHNGNINNWRTLVERYSLKMRGGCDSEVIFRMIDKFMRKDHMTVRAAIQRAVLVMTGTYACALINAHEPQKVYLFRNNAPIKIRHKRSGNIVLFASEASFIRRAYVEAELEKNHSNFYEMNELVLPNRHGMVIDNTIQVYGDWVEKAPMFSLDA